MKSKKTIFVVEDDPDISELITIVLTNQGFKVKAFLNSRKVEVAVKSLKPDLIIMDLWMQGLDGVTITKSLKNQKATSSIPIILVSAKNSLEKSAKLSGADDFLGKPFNIKDLIDIVNKFL